MIELGGNITLEGFQNRDYAELIVIKKIVGRYARQLSDQRAGFTSLVVTLRLHQGMHLITAACMVDALLTEASAQEPNLFVALDAALKRLAERR